MILSISISELLKKQDALIIDIRNEQNYNNNHIPSSKNIPKQILISNPSKYLDKNKTYYIYCSVGYTSAPVCNKLSSMGYKVVNVSGGYNSYYEIL